MERVRITGEEGVRVGGEERVGGGDGGDGR